MAKWEKIAADTYRLPVPGGWLYSVMWQAENVESVVFVPEEPVRCGHGNIGLCMPCLVGALAR